MYLFVAPPPILGTLIVPGMPNKLIYAARSFMLFATALCNFGLSWSSFQHRYTRTLYIALDSTRVFFMALYDTRTLSITLDNTRTLYVT